MSNHTDKTLLDGPRLQPSSGGDAKRLVIFLHGYGADGADLIDLGRIWQTSLPNAAFIAPDAPEYLPFEALGGRQWFPLDKRSPEEYRVGAEAVQPLLDRFLDQELSKLGLDERSLALVGFSQGSMMTLQAGLRRRLSPAALIAYSGLLPGLDRLSDIDTQSPVLLIHGDEDDVVPAYHLQGAEMALKAAGVSVEAHIISGLGHSIDERGLALGGRFLANAFAAKS
ncbi:MAG: dienelactone hydrolase family protein [Roseibium sp.]